MSTNRHFSIFQVVSFFKIFILTHSNKSVKTALQSSSNANRNYLEGDDRRLESYDTKHEIKHHHLNIPLELVNLTKTEYNEWYTDIERQVLNGDSAKCNNFGYFEQNCWMFNACNYPFKDRTGFYKGVHGFTNAAHNTLFELWNRLWNENKNVTILFVGDTLSMLQTRFFRSDVRRIYKNISSDCKNISHCRKTHDGSIVMKAESNNDMNYKIAFENLENNQEYVLRHVTYRTLQKSSSHLLSVMEQINFIDKKDCLILVSIGALFNEKEQFRRQIQNLYKIQICFILTATHNQKSTSEIFKKFEMQNF